MRELLLNHGLYVVWGIALIEAVFSVLFFIDFDKKKEWIIFFMGLLSVSITYDAIVMGIGVFTAEPILKVFSQMRFIFHGIFVPLNLIICCYALYWNGKKKTFSWILTILLMLLGAYTGCKQKIEIKEFAGIIRFASIEPETSWLKAVSGIFSFGLIIPVIITGLYLLIKRKQPEIFLAGFLMFLSSVITIITRNMDLIFLTSMFGEMLMLLFFMIHEKRHE